MRALAAAGDDGSRCTTSAVDICTSDNEAEVVKLVMKVGNLTGSGRSLAKTGQLHLVSFSRWRQAAN